MISRFRRCVLLLTLALPALVVHAAQEPEGVEWRLVEISGAAVAPIPGDRQPSLTLDPDKNQVTGFNGCNNYFAQYELHGESLKFGPAGATRRACPDPESVVERNFMDALPRTRNLSIKDGKLELRDDSHALLGFVRNAPRGTAVDIDSLTIRSKVYTAGPIRLAQGEYRGPAAPNSASEVVIKLTDKRAFGTIGGLEVGAVVVVTTTGGSGTFYELALLGRQGESWVNTDTMLLADRADIHSVVIEKEQIAVSMTTHAPNDPLCCPTMKLTSRYSVQGTRLVVTGEVPQPALVGAPWEWVQSRYNNDTQAVPPKPLNYTVKFENDGKLSIRADCNVKAGEYLVNDRSLSIRIINSTLAQCEPGSLDEQFARDLAGAANFFFREGDLYIDIKFDTGTMKFSRPASP